MNDTFTTIKYKPRVLMIAPVFYPYPPVWPEGIVNAKLALAMKNAGWQIDVIVAGYSGRGSSRYPADAAAWKELAENVHLVKIGEKSKFMVKPLINAIRGVVLTGQVLRRLAWGLSVVDKVKKLNARSKYDVILSRAIPDYAHFAALLVHRQTRIPWVANWNDPTPNHKFPPPYGQGPDSQLTPYLQKWYSAVCRHCSWHTFPSERLRDYMCLYLPGQIDTRSSVIPHVAMGEFNSQASPDDQFSLCYAGSVLPPREVTVFFEALKRFKASLNNAESFCVRFLVDKPELVAERAKAIGIEDVVKIEAAVPYSGMPEFLSRSDVLVIIEAPLEKGIFMPSKIVDYAQVRRPILALSPVVGTVADLFSRYGGGVSVDCQSADSVGRALETLYGHWKSGTLNQTFDSDGLLGHFSEERVLGLYLDLIEKLKSRSTTC
jgi:hypothetical protein